jgi:hypothetical protein
VRYTGDCVEVYAVCAFFWLMCCQLNPEMAFQKEYFATLQVDGWPWPATWINRCIGGKLRPPKSGLTWFNVGMCFDLDISMLINVDIYYR